MFPPITLPLAVSFFPSRVTVKAQADTQSHTGGSVPNRATALYSERVALRPSRHNSWPWLCWSPAVQGDQEAVQVGRYKRRL